MKNIYQVTWSHNLGYSAISQSFPLFILSNTEQISSNLWAILHFLMAQPLGWRLLHMDSECVSVCVCECVNDNFEPRDWSECPKACLSLPAQPGRN